MIKLTHKSDCCGCEACAQRCPHHCISLQPDEEGFLYPEVDSAHCTQCGLCERVCPVIHPAEPRMPSAIYAAKNPNEAIRLQSSSGGVFTQLAEAVIAQGGVVFGVKFNAQWEVVHDYTETLEGVAAFRGSKYVQSRVGDSFTQAEAFLKQGRPVLFSGTPCQIAGLHRYLRKPYEQLLTVDLICHGAPSPGVWQAYKADYLRQVKKNTVSQPLSALPTDILFRSTLHSTKTSLCKAFLKTSTFVPLAMLAPPNRAAARATSP